MSSHPDPTTHAYRKDLADTALAGQVIASHYADPLLRHIVGDAAAYLEPSDDSEEVGRVRAGDQIRMLDCSRGWAWGYLADGRVAYVRASAVSV